MQKRLPITKTEMKVLKLISDLKSTREIATELGLKSKTVENHRYNIARKLGLSGNNCVLKYAFEHQHELNNQ